MKQQNKQRYLIRYLSIFAILISIVIVKTSCTKLDVNYQANQAHPPNFVEQFFTTKTTPTPAVANLIQKLKDENERTGFVNKLPKNCGLPVWEKVVISKQQNNNENNNLYSPASHGPSANFTSEDSSEVDIIPLTITDSALSSLLIVNQQNNTTTTSSIMVNTDLYNYITDPNNTITDATKKLLLFFYMENKTFGTNIFYHVPSNLIPEHTILAADGSKTIFIDDVDTTISQILVCVRINCMAPGCSPTTICVDIPPPNDPGPPGGGGGGPCNTCTPSPPPNECNDPFYSFSPCGPPPPPPPPPPHNPCDSFIKYGQSGNMQLIVNELKNQVPTRRENLYIFNDLTNNNSPINYVQGQENQFEVYPTNETPFIGSYGWIHNHFADADSAGLIFSAGDLNILAEQVVRDSAFFQVNWKRFMIGVVADSGSNYMLMVEDLTKFKQWATGLYGNEFMIRTLYMANQMSQMYLPISKAESERRFLNMITPAGLKLFRGNSNGTSWTPIKLNSSGTVIENPCL